MVRRLIPLPHTWEVHSANHIGDKILRMHEFIRQSFLKHQDQIQHWVCAIFLVYYLPLTFTPSSPSNLHW